MPELLRTMLRSQWIKVMANKALCPFLGIMLMTFRIHALEMSARSRMKCNTYGPKGPEVINEQVLQAVEC